MAFIGVRISWLMLARNSLFAWLAASADFFASWFATSRSASSACSTERRMNSALELCAIAIIAARNSVSVAPSIIPV